MVKPLKLSQKFRVVLEFHNDRVTCVVLNRVSSKGVFARPFWCCLTKEERAYSVPLKELLFDSEAFELIVGTLTDKVAKECSIDIRNVIVLLPASLFISKIEVRNNVSYDKVKDVKKHDKQLFTRLYSIDGEPVVELTTGPVRYYTQNSKEAYLPYGQRIYMPLISERLRTFMPKNLHEALKKRLRECRLRSSFIAPSVSTVSYAPSPNLGTDHGYILYIDTGKTETSYELRKTTVRSNFPIRRGINYDLCGEVFDIELTKLYKADDNTICKHMLSNVLLKPGGRQSEAYFRYYLDTKLRYLFREAFTDTPISYNTSSIQSLRVILSGRGMAYFDGIEQLISGILGIPEKNVYVAGTADPMCTGPGYAAIYGAAALSRKRWRL